MRSLRLTPTRAAAIALIVVLAGLAAVVWWCRPQVARAASAGQLRQRISSGQRRAQSLAGAVHAASGRIAQLQAAIAPIVARLRSIQSDLNGKRIELAKLQGELTRTRARLAELEAFEARADGVLARQLVATYESPRPDLVTVVLQSQGFADLLERLAFATRVQKEDVRVVTAVRRARRAVSAEATRLGGLEVHQQRLTSEILQQRNALVSTHLSLAQQQLAIARRRSATASQLATVRGRVAALEGQLAKVITAQTVASAPSAPAPAPSAPATSAPGSSGAAPQASQGGGFTFPLPRGSASPPGTWSLDDGVDISAPGHTPLFAVGSGTIVLHGIGGFGPWAPVLHLDSGQYVYYGHAGPGNAVPIGTHVSAGQVVGEVGAGIVGISSGPHLELGFCDSSGTPLGPSTAPQMMSLLQGSY